MRAFWGVMGPKRIQCTKPGCATSNLGAVEPHALFAMLYDCPSCGENLSLGFTVPICPDSVSNSQDPSLLPVLHLMMSLLSAMKDSRSAVSMYILRPPGKRTTGMSPAQIRSRMAHTVSPSHAAASFNGSSLGLVGLSILCAF